MRYLEKPTKLVLFKKVASQLGAQRGAQKLKTVFEKLQSSFLNFDFEYYRVFNLFKHYIR